MTIIAVGIGNTTTQLAAYDDPAIRAAADGAWPEPSRTSYIRTQELVSEPRSDRLLEQTLGAVTESGSSRWCVASVHRAAEKRLQAWVARHRGDDAYRRLAHTDLPLKIAVEHPDRVGMDRLVAAVGANRMRVVDRPAVVVDAGTAVTVNLIDAAGIFQGGVILPGLATTARALSLDTDALPLVDFPANGEPPEVIGKSTEAAIRSGLFWGTVGAVRECVAQMRKQLAEPPQLFITGGDARRMAPLLGGEARFVEHLVLGGVIVSSVSIEW